MPFNIAAWKANGLVYGGARPTLFKVMLSVPPSIGIDPVSVTKFSFVCKAAALPAFKVNAIDVGYFGRKIKVAGDRQFDDWEVVINNDEDFAVRALFEKWSNAINRLVSNVRDPSLAAEEYKVDMQVIQYAKDGDDIRSYNIIGAWPMDIGAITLGWEDENQIEQFGVSFSVDYIEPIIESSDKKAGGINEYGDQVDIDGPNGPL